eukprot:TRINITY_DN100755_c0_g1_i1.p1 TRINITY_DN100755_c0_g1~~TRINITY_DN100755_c0_g1_i1.p1  ORF type:complete len:790 (-),score=216.75 TRINITY_DN100755_c0_g1_i1:43-2412(-)
MAEPSAVAATLLGKRPRPRRGGGSAAVTPAAAVDATPAPAVVGDLFAASLAVNEAAEKLGRAADLQGGVSLGDVASLMEVAVAASSEQAPVELSLGASLGTTTVELSLNVGGQGAAGTKVAASGSKETLFAVRLDRSGGARLGIDVETGQQAKGWDGKTLLVKGIQAEGLVPRWNLDHPKKAVAAEDRIVEANGQRGDAMAILAECKKAGLLDLRIRRPPAVAQKKGLKDAAALAASSAAAANVSVRPRSAHASDEVVRVLRKEVSVSKSATAIVKLVRRELGRRWAPSWGAAALLGIWKRSTVLTRREWVQEKTVLELVDALRREVTVYGAARHRYGSGTQGEMTATDVETLLVAMEALQRLELQTAASQEAAIARLAGALAAGNWALASPAGLARLLWVSGPLRLESMLGAMAQMRQTCYKDLVGSDLVMLVEAVHRWSAWHLADAPKRVREGGLLHQLSGRSEAVASEEYRLTFEVTLHAAASGSEESPTIIRLDVDDEETDARTLKPLRRRMATFSLVPGSTRLRCVLGLEGDNRPTFEMEEPGLPIGKPVRVTLLVGTTSSSIFINGDETPLHPTPLPYSVVYDARGVAFGGQQHDLEVQAGPSGCVPANASIGNCSYQPLGLRGQEATVGGRDEALLQKLAVRLHESEKILAGMLTFELVVLAEGLDELGVRDMAALKALGQEILTRKAELTSEEGKRAHVIFKQSRIPLDKVWEAVGAKKRKTGHAVLTTQTFAPQPGHADESDEDKKQDADRRGGKGKEIARVSPPRQYQDPMQCMHQRRC